MTKFVVDCGVAIHLVTEGIEVPAGHELLAPTLLRSQAPSVLHEAVHRGELPPDVALDRLQADAFVTLDTDLARRLAGIVPTATIEALGTAAQPRR
jgi:hypothetical protein